MVLCDPITPNPHGFVERFHRTLNQECLKRERPKTLDEVRQVTEALATHSNWQRPHQGMSCGNQPPRVAFPEFPSLPSLPDLVNPDAWLNQMKGQHLVRKVNRRGFIKVDLYPYYISNKLAGQKVTLSIQAKPQELQVVYPHEYRRSLPLKGLHQRALPRSGSTLTSCSAKLLLNTACDLRGGGKVALTECSLHTMLRNSPSDEVGKSYTQPVGEWSRALSDSKAAASY